MNGALVEALLAPHMVAVALSSSRLLPVAFLCPLLGGQAAPTSVRLALTLSLSCFFHFGAGVAAPLAPPDTLTLLGWVVRELILGTTIGLAAALPFDAARMGGRFIDLFRGSSAEASLPSAGSREAATGDVLHQLTVALAMSGMAMPLAVRALGSSFSLVPLGSYVPGEGGTFTLVHLAMASLTTGLAIGAPVAAVSLGVDATLGMCAKVFPALQLSEVGTPVRILGGAAMVWMGLGLISSRLLAGLADLPEVVQALLS